MNKGIAVATGEYVNFMNAGDRFFSSKVVARVFNRRRSADFMCGVARYYLSTPLPHKCENKCVKKPRTKYWMPVDRKFKFSQVKNGYAVNHQASFMRRALFESRLYEIK